jgi:hypothetical protein
MKWLHIQISDRGRVLRRDITIKRTGTFERANHVSHSCCVPYSQITTTAVKRSGSLEGATQITLLGGGPNAAEVSASMLHSATVSALEGGYSVLLEGILN